MAKVGIQQHRHGNSALVAAEIDTLRVIQRNAQLSFNAPRVAVDDPSHTFSQTALIRATTAANTLATAVGEQTCDSGSHEEAETPFKKYSALRA